MISMPRRLAHPKRCMARARVLTLLATLMAVVVGKPGQVASGQEEAQPASFPAVGAAAVELVSDDSMVIAGGIHPRYVRGQEGQLRATAIVFATSPETKVAFVSCDVLMVTRELLEPALEQIERQTGIPRAHVLVAPTHTHHAPSTIRVHGYGADEAFCRQLQQAVADAVVKAAHNLEPVTAYFAMGEEKTVGQNSRLLLSDGTIFWIGPRHDAIGPTGPVDTDLPVLFFRRPDGSMKAFLFAHATHAIGTVKGDLRSPTFYGLAVQELEKEWNTIGAYFPGPCGSTHRLDVPPAEAQQRIMRAVRDAVAQAQPLQLEPVRAVRREFHFFVRHFDEEAEQRAVEYYCRTRTGGSADAIIEVFRQMRRELAPLQGQKKATEIQAIRLGDVCFVGVPAELFPSVGFEIRRRSPFRITYVIELANDWIGYVPDERAFDLGGYQVWTGFHSYVSRGTGERLVREVVRLLHDISAAD